MVKPASTKEVKADGVAGFTTYVTLVIHSFRWLSPPQLKPTPSHLPQVRAQKYIHKEAKTDGVSGFIPNVTLG